MARLPPDARQGIRRATKANTRSGSTSTLAFMTTRAIVFEHAYRLEGFVSKRFDAPWYSLFMIGESLVAHASRRSRSSLLSMRLLQAAKRRSRRMAALPIYDSRYQPSKTWLKVTQ
jgi:hypothetical protein